MYQQKKAVFQRTFLAFDLFLTVVSFVLAYRIKTAWFPGALGALYPLREYLGIFFLILPLWAFLLSRANIYEPISTEHSITWILRLAKYLAYGFLLLIFLLFGLRIQYVSRLLLFLFLGVNFLVLTSAHLALATIYRVRIRKRRPRLMLAGPPEKVEAFLNRLGKERTVNVDISAVYFLGDTGRRKAPGHVPSWVPEGMALLRQQEEIAACVHERLIDEIIFAIRPEDLPAIEEILARAEEEGIISRIVADVFELKVSRASWDQLGSIPMITFTRAPSTQWQFFFKSVLDVSLAMGGIIFLSPLFLAVAILVKRSSPGPILFRQQRIGLHGRPFTMLKFRTMIQGAQDMQKELLRANELSGPAFKMQEDPRVTRVGRFLRRHSLDELPQSLNVLAGNMSLVGPRPALPEEVIQYQPWQRRRLSMRPGITGLWQVAGRDKRDFNDWVLLDLDYIDRWSLSLDLRILWMTLPQVILGKGV